MRRGPRVATHSTLLGVTCHYNILCLFLFVVATDRPKRLVVIVNPNSGKKQAEKVFNKKIKPIFRLCNIETTVYGKLPIVAKGHSTLNLDRNTI